MKSTLLLYILFLVISLASQPVMAVSVKDIQVAARTFSFINGLSRGNLEVTIIYDPTSEVSKSDAEELHAIMSSGLKAGKFILKSRLLKVSSIQALSSKVAYVTSGMEGQYDAISAATSVKSVLSFSTDFSCVAEQKCVMGIVAQPNVKIEISRAAADASGLRFAQALKLMVSEKD